MKHVISIILLMVSLCGCNHNRQITKEFDNMLQAFGASIPEDAHYFVVIPAFSCSGCVQFTWFYIDSIITAENINNISIIDGCSSERNHFATKIDCEIFYDRTNLLGAISYNFANPTIIKTENKEIKYIATTDSRYMRETLQRGLEKEISKFQ